MADQSSSQEKTEEATPKRMRESRKKGQVAKSKDLNTVVILIGAFALIVACKGFIAKELLSLMQQSFDVATTKDLSADMLFLQVREAYYSYINASSPFLIAITVIAFAVAFFQIGPIFSAEPMKPQLKRINIIENVKNMFKMTTLIELLKNIAKISLIFFIAYLVMSDSLREIVLSTTATPDQSSQVASKIVAEFLMKVFVIFIIIAVIDFAVQRWQHKKQMRMSKDEVKREYKQDEGDPMIKSQRRQLHQELANSDMKQAVGMSDAVITNPTHLAIAVQYDDKEMAAPMITAKGQRLFAEKIKEYAEEAGVPIVHNPPLAWTLLELEIGDEIPDELYQAVAEVLVYVYTMKE